MPAEVSAPSTLPPSETRSPECLPRADGVSPDCVDAPHLDTIPRP